ncbi:4-diphosphocytidyl-2-C-methyl-D-erythritol kinase [Candidatus Photodesmus blepharus]|uniref:4-diphosphocytidyl-2-C-methyl-D-erythritol kinase n=1 Tax=Candidatus Photodesmus blepharonis TaxID=1179155 RepID=A0A084CPC2_9GAMM|nr:4-(cytidine 5'-diphospho)-2-C-methyl-D-erythritol kinase [Candidatus Photodesmus blepharus]KEY91651.1 4-diphosphocytidyl-2-C-methyl-D-erythritol kinase [Candidatus Photodesmus blepharus]
MFFQTTCWPSPAKLNLFLNIIGRKDDGYHDLQTLFQFLDYSDQIIITANQTGKITLSPKFAKLKIKDNLIWKAAKILQKHSNHTLGADIKLNKILPIGGGLGGGSSNAATTLVALNLLWNLGLSDNQLADIGLTLGADVPVFVRGFAAFAEGVGEKLFPTSPEEKWYLVVKPNVSISTTNIFSHPNLTRNTKKQEITTLLQKKYTNDCEKIVRILHSEVDRQLLWLLQYAPFRLTGTGSCLFSEFTEEKEAKILLKRLLSSSSVSAFVAQGRNVSPLKETSAKYQSVLTDK